MSQKLIMIFLAMSVVACAKIDENLLKDEKSSDLADVTNTSSCDGPTNIGQSVLNRSWRLDFQSSTGVGRKDVMTFTANTVRLDRTCYFNSVNGNVSASVSTTSNSSLNSDSVLILSNSKNETTIKVDDKDRECAASLQSGQLMEYSFVGNCLRMKVDGKYRMLIPAN